jgi:nitrite reductase/ring-hydroxylating ferredoxin subunit
MSWLSDKLTALVAERSITVEAMARQFAVEKSRIADILSGAARPNDSLIKRLAKYFGEDPAEWLANSADAATPKRQGIELPADFITVAKVDEIDEGEMKIVFHDLAVVANVEGSYHAFGNLCPHAGGPIGDGFFDGFVVECPWHAGRWDMRTGCALTMLATADIPVFEVRVVDDDVQIKLSDAALAQKVVQPR